MALEQLLAFLEDRSQDELGPTSECGPDRFPLLESSDVKPEHELINALLGELTPAVQNAFAMKGLPVADALLDGDRNERTRCYLAMLERIFAYEAGLQPREADDYQFHSFFGYGPSSTVLRSLFDKGVELDVVLAPTLRWVAAHRNLYYGGELLESLLRNIQQSYATRPVPDDIRQPLIDIRSQMFDGEGYGHQPAIAEKIDEILGAGIWTVVFPGEVWTDHVIKQLERMPLAARENWLALLQLCQTAKSAKPSARWSKTAASLLDPIPAAEFKDHALDWFRFVDRGKTRPILCSLWESIDERQRIHDVNANILRGLLWLCIDVANPDVCRAVSNVALSAYRKVRGLGPRAVKVGNAAVYVLGEIANGDAVAQLAILKIRVKFGTAQKGIEKALVATAERVGIPRDELEEMSVPAYGLTEVGMRREALGGYLAEIAVAGSKTELRWFRADGKQQKSIPAAVKKDFADDLKELKQAVKDIDKMIPAQSARIEQTYLHQKKWEVPVWRERYLDHPLVGALARRLIWQFADDGASVTAIYHEGRFVGHDHQPVESIGDAGTVTLWHPLDEDAEEVTAWRRWLMDHEVKQSFKQAHREIYILTDAERNTNVYSNRFAAHVLKQHQFNALCGARGWKNQLRMMVDSEYPPASLDLSEFQLRAEFWVEGVGENYGVDTNESGAYLYLTTDQVRFYRRAAEVNTAHAIGGGYRSLGTEDEPDQPLPLEEVPPLVFSEVMRDVDLFVGVSSVANDPNWSDGGPEGRYLDYWQSYSFGELSATARTRKSVLEILIPRLKIADRCSFVEKFLVVRGSLRTYKIHLGSGNILMEPNDQYLCIVPKQSVTKASERVFLPFEGDNMLSIILSKAMLLADDAKIKDTTITSQIKPR